MFFGIIHNLARVCCRMTSRGWRMYVIEHLCKPGWAWCMWSEFFLWIPGKLSNVFVFDLQHMLLGRLHSNKCKCNSICLFHLFHCFHLFHLFHPFHPFHLFHRFTFYTFSTSHFWKIVISTLTLSLYWSGQFMRRNTVYECGNSFHWGGKCISSLVSCFSLDRIN